MPNGEAFHRAASPPRAVAFHSATTLPGQSGTRKGRCCLSDGSAGARVRRQGYPMTSDPASCFVYITLPGATEPVTAGRFALSTNRRGMAEGEFVYGRTYLERGCRSSARPGRASTGGSLLSNDRAERRGRGRRRVPDRSARVDGVLPHRAGGGDLGNSARGSPSPGRSSARRRRAFRDRLEGDAGRSRARARAPPRHRRAHRGGRPAGRRPVPAHVAACRAVARHGHRHDGSTYRYQAMCPPSASPATAGCRR